MLKAEEQNTKPCPSKVLGWKIKIILRDFQSNISLKLIPKYSYFIKMVDGLRRFTRFASEKLKNSRLENLLKKMKIFIFKHVWRFHPLLKTKKILALKKKNLVYLSVFFKTQFKYYFKGIYLLIHQVFIKHL